MPPAIRNSAEVCESTGNINNTPSASYADSPSLLETKTRPNSILEIPSRTYKPYQTATLETPLLHLMLAPFPSVSTFLKPFFALVYRIRWFLSRPLQVKLVPHWCPPFPHALRNYDLASLTVGETAILVPLIIFFLRGYHYTFVSLDLTENGTMSTYAIYVCFLTANKSNSIFSFILGVPFERMIPLHQMASFVAVVLGGFHTYAAFNYGGDDDGDSIHTKFGEDPDLVKFMVDGNTNRTGSVLIGSMFLSVVLSFFPIVRRLFFNFWLYGHIILGVMTLAALFLHNVHSAAFVTAWWALDLMTRYGAMAMSQNRVPKAHLRLIGTDENRENASNEPAVEISFRKTATMGGYFDYNAGQFVQIAIPKLSIFEFHPITISSAPHEDVVTLHIRELGDWTSRLVELAKTTDTTEIWIEGPYGVVSLDIDDDKRYRMALMISGGIGVTPCQSIGKMLVHQHKTEGRHLKYLRFVWSVRSMKIVNDLPPLGGTDDFSKNSFWYQRHAHRRSTRLSNKLQNRHHHHNEHKDLQGFVSSDDEENDHDDIRQQQQQQLQPAVEQHPLDTQVASSSNPVSRAGAGTASIASSTGAKKRRPALIQVDIHCTRGTATKDEETLEDAMLPYNVYHGRPDLDALFEETKENAILMGETNVAVFGCGPVALMSSLERACRKHSSSVIGCDKSPVFFEMHKENFDY